MKNIKILLTLVLFSFILVQCTKDTKNDEISEKIEIRSDLDCHAEGHPNGTCYVIPSYSITVNIDPVETGIPASVIGNCTMDGIYNITICLNPFSNKILSFEFDEFKMDFNDCDLLINWLDNLKESDSIMYDEIINDLSNYVAYKAKNSFMELMILNNGENLSYPLETKSYLVKCYTKVVSTELIPIYSLSGSSDPADWEILGYEEKTTVSFMSCGNGCCLERTVYFIDKGGDIDKNTVKFSAGFCEPQNMGSQTETNEQIELRGEEDDGCYQRCN